MQSVKDHWDHEMRVSYPRSCFQKGFNCDLIDQIFLRLTNEHFFTICHFSNREIDYIQIQDSILWRYLVFGRVCSLAIKATGLDTFPFDTDAIHI